MLETIQEQGVMRVYGCGGGGINLTKAFAGVGSNAVKEPGVANVKIVYLDTSRSNLNGVADDAEVFIVPEMDGGGSFRATTYQPIKEQIPRIMKDYPPTDFNVVVFTAGGGTGGVFGGLLIEELVNRKQNVIAITVGSQDSVKAASNTFSTLKTLDNISRTKGRPVVMHYSTNSSETPRSMVDKDVAFVLSSLAILASKQNKALDTEDLKNWVNFTQTTKVPSQLAVLRIFSSPEDLDNRADQPFTIAKLMKTHDDPQPRTMPEYECTGYYPQGIDVSSNLFFSIEVNSLRPILNRMHELSQQAEEIVKARLEGPRFTSGDEETGSDSCTFL